MTQETNDLNAAVEGRPSPEEKPAPEGTSGPQQQPAPEGTKPAKSLFNLLGDPEEKEGQGAKSGSKTPAKPAATGPKKYEAGTEVRYSGHTKTLEKEMTEKEILDWLSADDFPELSAPGTYLRHDREKNRIVPVQVAQKKGAPAGGAPNPAAAMPASFEVLSAPPEGAYPPVFRLLGGDGVYEVRTTPVGQLVARVPGGLVCSEGFFPSGPRCPASHLATIVEAFKAEPDKEAMVTIVYDALEADFQLLWHGDDRTPVSVVFDRLPDDERYLLYAEVHSHHRMAAAFSRQDDAFETKAAVYGVFGDVDEDRPTALFRYACGRHFRFLPAEEVFTPPAEVWRLVDGPSRF